MAVTEILASVDDVNTHLPTDKINAGENDPQVISEIDLIEVDTARYIRSMLYGTFSQVTLAGWDSPANTPETIRGIAGRLIAAKWYSVRYAEDSDESSYAQNLYDEALSMIRDIRSGSLVVLDDTLTPIDTAGGTDLTSDDFWPNDSTSGPKFTMDREFA